MKAYGGSIGIAPLIVNLGTRRDNFTPWPLGSQSNNPTYTLNRRSGGPHCQSRHLGRGEKISCFMPRIEPRFFVLPLHSAVTIPSELCQLIHKDHKHPNTHSSTAAGGKQNHESGYNNMAVLHFTRIAFHERNKTDN